MLEMMARVTTIEKTQIELDDIFQLLPSTLLYTYKYLARLVPCLTPPIPHRHDFDGRSLSQNHILVIETQDGISSV